MTSLDLIPPQRSAAITALRLAPAEAAWLRAIGLSEGVRVTMLRRAPLGGPLHVRISTGAELAVDRELARQVEVDAPTEEAPT